jgi:glycosyltransferase involved in cell wall biosynthesis
MQHNHNGRFDVSNYVPIYLTSRGGFNCAKRSITILTDRTAESVIDDKARIPVLFVHYGDQWIRGSEQILLDLLARIDRRRFEPIVWCNGTEMAKQVAALDIQVYQSPFLFYLDNHSPRFNPLAYARNVAEGRRIVTANRVQVIHVNSAAPAQWMVPVARLTRTPVVSHLHAVYLRRGRFASLVHQSDVIAGVSHRVVEHFVKDGMTPERIRVVYNGVDMTTRPAIDGRGFRNRFRLDEDNLVIASAGSLIPRKGFDVLLAAFASGVVPVASCLLILGDGPERASLEALSAKLGLQNRVRFCGHLPRDDVASIFAHCDIVALASRDDAFALVLAEAGRCGVAVVATDVGGIPEVVVNEETGLLVPPDDVEMFADALRRLATDAPLRRRLGDRARARVEHLFDAAGMVAKFQDIYDELASKPPASLGWGRVIAARKPYARLFGFL